MIGTVDHVVDELATLHRATGFERVQVLIDRSALSPSSSRPA